MSTAVDSADIYTDFSGLARLRRQAQTDSRKALGEVARQFEAVLLQQTMKAMRQAVVRDDLLNSNRMQFYEDMYDQQLALHLSKTDSLGFAKILMRQLGGEEENAIPDGRDMADYRSRALPRRPVEPPEAIPISEPQSTAELAAAPTHEKLAEIPIPVLEPADQPINLHSLRGPEDFLSRLWTAAEPAARELGVDPAVLLAQAALETGWGRKVIQHPDNGSSNNLFGIKTGKRWSGDSVTVASLEYESGQPVHRRSAFRAYADVAESFADYARFIQGNQRYAPALQADDAEGYLRGLQQAGYATDPRYADKILDILRRPSFQAQVEQLRSGSLADNDAPSVIEEAGS
ncbi:MAG: flagellar assembly peptidoglycan hydrolase FlgJ [Chromatiales bacterium]|nr:flagellar assembly peptidoglycan hydrolase FlgJ [Chromatiales bacterium]